MQLLERQYNWCIALDNNIVTDVILIDFTEAFDDKPHSKLIHKLASLDTCHPTLHWMTAFQHDTYQSVVLNGSYSSQSAVTSGVVQGSIIRPKLFTLYVNDLPEACLPVQSSSLQMISKPANKLSNPIKR